MLFNSLQFAIFLPIVFAAYWTLPNKYRWPLLLAASYYFYMSWNARYVILIAVTTVISWLSALALEKTGDAKRKKAILWAALLVCLGILLVFKYFNFFAASVSQIAGWTGIGIHPVTLRLLLPVGISFYTFQTLGYVIDVYRGDLKAERHLGIYAVYVSFFPQLVAGPIERAKNLLPQIRAERAFQYTQAAYGLKLMAWGFFKKLVIADVLAVHVDRIYNDIYQYHGLSLLAATVFFAFQIYCDFSGYSDIAVGTANLFGIDLMTNFSSPYYSASLKEFWSRWHISLSTWFRDYVYIPFGGNRKGKARAAWNLLVTFLLSGLWHGASWTYVVWGGAHGALQTLERRLPHKEVKPPKSWWRVILIFAVVCMCWTFFRAGTIREAAYVFAHGLDGIGHIKSYVLNGYRDLHIGKVRALKILVSLILLAVYDYLQLGGDVIRSTEKLPFARRWLLYYALVGWILLAGNFGGNQFVYFQF